MGPRRGPQPRPARHPDRARSATTRATASTTGRGMNDIPLIKAVPFMLAHQRRCAQLRGRQPAALARVADLGGRQAPRRQDPDARPARSRHELRRAPRADRRLHHASTPDSSAGRTSSPAPTAASRRGRATPRRCTQRSCGRSSAPWPRAPQLGDLPAVVLTVLRQAAAAVEVDDALVAVDGDRLAGLDHGGADVRADHRRDAELAGDDRAVQMIPPTSETTAPASENSGTHGGSVISTTMISPSSRSSLAWASDRHHARRAGVHAG